MFFEPLGVGHADPSGRFFQATCVAAGGKIDGTRAINQLEKADELQSKAMLSEHDWAIADDPA